MDFFSVSVQLNLFLGMPLGGGEANSAASARDNGDLSFKSRHCYAPLHLVALPSRISVPIGSDVMVSDSDADF
jgi:hypothetical protein